MTACCWSSSSTEEDFQRCCASGTLFPPPFVPQPDLSLSTCSRLPEFVPSCRALRSLESRAAVRAILHGIASLTVVGSPDEPPGLELAVEIEAGAVRCRLHGERFSKLALTSITYSRTFIIWVEIGEHGTRSST